MNHQKVIIDTINRYADFPTVQADMRKLLKYAESQFRMFLVPITKEDARKMDTVDTEIDGITEMYEPGTPERAALLELNGLLLASIAATGSGRTKVVEALKAHLVTHRHNLSLHGDMKKVAQLFVDAIEEEIILELPNAAYALSSDPSRGRERGYPEGSADTIPPRSTHVNPR